MAHNLPITINSENKRELVVGGEIQFYQSTLIIIKPRLKRTCNIEKSFAILFGLIG